MILAHLCTQRSNYIETAMNANAISGVVLSPQTIDATGMLHLASHYRNLSPAATILFDPEFQAFTFSPSKLQKLTTYPYSSVSRLLISQLSTGAIRQPLINSCLQYQSSLPVNFAVSPTIIIDSFGGLTEQVAIDMAYDSIVAQNTIHPSRGLLASFCIAQSALANTTGLNNFLNTISTLTCEGMYLTIYRTQTDYPANITPTEISNLLYLVYSLGTLNRFYVHCGMTDTIGVNLLACGAYSLSTGWFLTSRQCTLKKFSPSTGGRQSKRYTSAPLFHPILIDELNRIQGRGMLNQVLSGTPEDNLILTGTHPWTLFNRRVSICQHWRVLGLLGTQVSTLGSVTANLNQLQTNIGNSLTIYQSLQNNGILFSPRTGPRDVTVYRDGLHIFRTTYGV